MHLSRAYTTVWPQLPLASQSGKTRDLVCCGRVLGRRYAKLKQAGRRDQDFKIALFGTLMRAIGGADPFPIAVS